METSAYCYNNRETKEYEGKETCRRCEIERKKSLWAEVEVERLGFRFDGFRRRLGQLAG